MSTLIVNPTPFLHSLLSHPCTVRLKWGLTYTGTLLSTDSYMNIRLGDATEFVGDIEQGKVGEVLIRCNNVLFVKEGGKK